MTLAKRLLLCARDAAVCVAAAWAACSCFMSFILWRWVNAFTIEDGRILVVLVTVAAFPAALVYRYLEHKESANDY